MDLEVLEINKLLTILKLKIMGWGTEFKKKLSINIEKWKVYFNTYIYLNRQLYNNKQEVIDQLKEVDSDINENIALIKMYAISTPKDINNIEVGENCIYNVNNSIDSVIEMLTEDIINRYKLQLYLEYLEDNNIEKIDHMID